ncbi:MlaE family lipid ABC transporter permease subunit [Desulfobaculum bizertense]|uniref:ABC transporter permease n=1 Tax=Desulfobaculum bizertense TaxID=376490 RepID=UPI001F29F6D4|nr:MlaE family lipid ABC transporter permease subunit [Desulfobaculum bizertense]UIJ36840.1 MlaE family lipid ABC transporter permease subunit [Desulfobaculum bizertense]
MTEKSTETVTERPAACFLPSTRVRGGRVISGRLDATGTALIWQAATDWIHTAPIPQLTLDLSELSYLDGSGAALIMHIKRLCAEKNLELSIENVPAHVQKLLTLFTEEETPKESPREKKGFIESLGHKGRKILNDSAEQVAFIGESSRALLHALRQPHVIRWKDYWAVCESAGVNALPIIALIGFLMGLIMSFQSAVPMRRFGADIYVANLLGLSMLRELGPLVTAILLAGRSGSAFAAEIGTMKVNEEVAALQTMGLDPLRFLMIPRVLAALTVTPFLTIFFNFFALIGGALVVTGFGYTLSTYVSHVLMNVTIGDFTGGLFKAFVFSILVAGVGCQRGLTTGSGASAVGSSTTSSVVSGLILIAVSDGIMATVFFALGI